MHPDRNLRSRLHTGPPLLGTFSITGSTDVVELIALAGFDLVILDMEHGPFDLREVGRCLLAAHTRGLQVIVRVARAEPAVIGSVLDLGVDGVLIPHVSTTADAAAVVSAARYPPQGTRGAHPWVRATGYGSGSEQGPAAVLVMIEGVRALEELDAILRVPGLDAVFLGPVDLSHALGVPGQPTHPVVVDAVRGALRLAADVGPAGAVFTTAPEDVAGWWDRGAALVACSVDTSVVLDALTATARRARGPAA